jgi:transcription antitermination protein NusB
MASRRQARERALQALYQEEVAGETPGAEELVWSGFDADDEAGAFARELVAGVSAERMRIDALLADALEHWEIGRLARVDLSLLRLAVYEMMARPEIPHAVTIDEAVEIAGRFGSSDSPAFVNGVLDRVARTLGRKPSGEGR